MKMARSMLDACSVICVNLTEVNNEKLALLFGLNIFFLMTQSLFVLASTDYQAAASADQGSLPGLPQWRHTNCG